MTPQLANEEIGAEEEHVLYEVTGGPCAAVLRETMNQQDGVAEDRLRERLRFRLETRDHQRPPVRCLDLHSLLLVQIAQRYVIDCDAVFAWVRSSCGHDHFGHATILLLQWRSA